MLGGSQLNKKDKLLLMSKELLAQELAKRCSKVMQLHQQDKWNMYHNLAELCAECAEPYPCPTVQIIWGTDET